MEIGSFIELQLPRGREYYRGDNVRRLNSGRAAIYYAFSQTRCQTIFLPVYQCHSVAEFLERKNVNIKYYNIDENFTPILAGVDDSECVLIVNYFGIISYSEMVKRCRKFKNVIVDNAPAFFAKPITNTYNIYSARKFFGVPDGSYVVSDLPMDNADFEADYSSNTSAFLLQRIEYGCEGRAYHERELNEKRIDDSDVLKMSKLTNYLLDSIDYEEVMTRRKRNFLYAAELFDKINRIDVKRFLNDDCVPMVYPLMHEDEAIQEKLIRGKHFQGRWWKYIVDLTYSNPFEKRLSSMMVPITIDQRYDKSHLDYIKSLING